jgi:hypothetical protein
MCQPAIRTPGWAGTSAGKTQMAVSAESWDNARQHQDTSLMIAAAT